MSLIGSIMRIAIGQPRPEPKTAPALAEALERNTIAAERLAEALAKLGPLYDLSTFTGPGHVRIKAPVTITVEAAEEGPEAPARRGASSGPPAPEPKKH